MNNDRIKPIRFNLKFYNGKGDFAPARSLQELREVFNVDDLYDYFRSGQLERWLVCRDANSEAELVKNIDKNQSVRKQLTELFAALKIEADEEDRQQVIASFDYHKRAFEKKQSLLKDIRSVDNTIRGDVKEYYALIDKLIASHEDFAEVKAIVKTILDCHYVEFKMDWFRFTQIMLKKCPLAMFPLLANVRSRRYYIPSECVTVTKDGDVVRPVEDECCLDGAPMHHVQHVREQVENFLKGRWVNSYGKEYKVLLNNEELTPEHPHWYLINPEKRILKDLDSFEAGKESWQDEFVDKEIMVIWNFGVEVRAHGDREHQYVEDNELYKKFMILNGLDYRVKPGTSQQSLAYVEI